MLLTLSFILSASSRRACSLRSLLNVSRTHPSMFEPTTRTALLTRQKISGSRPFLRSGGTLFRGKLARRLEAGPKVCHASVNVPLVLLVPAVRSKFVGVKFILRRTAAFSVTRQGHDGMHTPFNIRRLLRTLPLRRITISFLSVGSAYPFAIPTKLLASVPLALGFSLAPLLLLDRSRTPVLRRHPYRRERISMTGHGHSCKQVRWMQRAHTESLPRVRPIPVPPPAQAVIWTVLFLYESIQFRHALFLDPLRKHIVCVAHRSDVVVLQREWELQFEVNPGQLGEMPHKGRGSVKPVGHGFRWLEVVSLQALVSMA